MAFIKAKRTKTFARLGLMGPTNAGKTYSAIIIAVGLVKAGLAEEGITEPTLQQIFDRIAVLDTERGRAKFYANRSDLPVVTGEFWYNEIKAPYTPNKFIEGVLQAAELVGEKGVVITDSISHAWAYSGGLLDIKEDIAKKAGKNSYTAWQEAGKMQNEMVDKILDVPCHTISTMRTKMDYVLEVNEKGKTAPKQVGLAPIQRDDLEYEFDITLSIDKITHSAIVVKDTTFLGDSGSNLGLIEPKLGERLYTWLNQGADANEFKEEERLNLIKQIQMDASSDPELKALYKTGLFPNTKSKDLTLKEAQHVINKFAEYKLNREQN